MKRKKINGDGIKLATLLYGPPKTETSQQELPLKWKVEQQEQAEGQVDERPSNN